VDLGGVELILRIDERITPPSRVWVHFQRDPYPGRHRYFLSFRGPEAERIFPGLQPHEGAVSEALGRDVLTAIEFRPARAAAA
jgi:hypothetical protein